MGIRSRWITGLFVVVLVVYSNVFSQAVEELMSQGNGLLSNGAFNEAITVFKKLLGKDPSNAEAQSNLAFAYLSAGRYQNAVTEYTKAIGMSPKTAVCWQNRGFAYDKLGKRSKAMEDIHHSIELDPSNMDARMNLAAFHEDAKQYDRAIAEYDAVIKIDGLHHGEAYVSASRCMTEKGNMAGAKKYLSEAITTNPNYAEAHYQLGNIYWKKEKKTDEALKEYQTAAMLDANNPAFYENWAYLLEDLNRKQEAIETWKKCLIYLNEALKKDEIQARIDKLEKGESVTPTGADKKAARAESDKKTKEDMEKLKKDLRKDKAETSKRIDAPPPDVMGDIADINKDKGEDLDLRQAAKKKAASDKGADKAKK
jgi:tetratricopeptide (TPR) repeat protein